MSDEDLRVKALIEIGLDQKIAEQAVGSIHKLETSVKATEVQVRKLIRTGEEFARFGATIAGAGGAILAPVVLAAQAYTQRFGQLEKVSRNYLATQQRQADATARLGRVSAEALTPVFSKLAELQERLAAFAEKNPNLVKLAVGAGGVLVTAGSVLAAIGVTVSAVGKGVEVIGPLFAKLVPALSGLVQGVAGIAVPLAAVAIAAKGTEGFLNELGKASGDERLEHLKLADVLKTFRATIGTELLLFVKAFYQAREAIERLADIFKIIVTQLVSGITGGIDTIATGIAVLIKQLQSAAGEFLNGLLETVATVAQQFDGTLAGKIRGGKDTNAIRDSRADGSRGENAYDYEIRKLLAGLSERDKGRQADVEKAKADAIKNEQARAEQAKKDTAALAAFADQVTQFVETGSLGDLDKIFAKAGDLLSQGFKSVTGFFGGLLSQASPSGGGAAKGGGGLSPEAVNAYITRNKSIAESNRGYDVERANNAKQYAQESQKAERDYQAALLQLQQEGNQDSLEIERKYRQESARALADFKRNEAQIERKQQLDAEARLKQHKLKLTELASEGDTDQFLAETKQFALSEELQKKQENFDRDTRKAEFDQSQKDRDQQFAEERRTQQLDYDKRLNELKAQHSRENDERRIAYNEQQNALQEKHRLELETIDRNFAEQLASLNQNLAGLNDIQNAFYAQQQVEAQTFVDQYSEKLRSLYSQSLGFQDSGLTGLINSVVGSVQNAIGSLFNNLFHPHSNGIDVPFDRYPILAHRGELLLNAPQADQYRTGGASKSVSVSIGSITVGSPADIMDIKRAINDLVEAM